jgi:hypothetical protein
MTFVNMLYATLWKRDILNDTCLLNPWGTDGQSNQNYDHWISRQTVAVRNSSRRVNKPRNKAENY